MSAVISPTQLRQNLFANLRRVANGASLTVETKDGNVVLVAERSIQRKKRHSKAPLIPGGVVDLDGADEALRAYLVLPK